MGGVLKKIQQKAEAKKKLIEASQNKEIFEMDIDTIKDNPYQPRLNIEKNKLKELAESIKEKGLIQPVPVAIFNQGSKNEERVLIAGHRRLAAHKLLGLKKIKVNIQSELNKQDLASMALIENLQRDDLDILEVALQYKILLDKKIFKSARDLSKSIGKSETTVSKTLNLLNLPQKVVDDLRENKSTKDIVALDALRRVKDQDEISELYFWFISTKASRVDLLEKIKLIKNTAIATKKWGKVDFSKDKFILKINRQKIAPEIDVKINTLLEEIKTLLKMEK